MVFELVKNSLRAVQERFVDSDKVAPPIRIIVADGIEDVTIKVLVGCCITYIHEIFSGCKIVWVMMRYHFLFFDKYDEVSFFTSHLQGKAKKKKKKKENLCLFVCIFFP
jgi:hypothetical protein